MNCFLWPGSNKNLKGAEGMNNLTAEPIAIVIVLYKKNIEECISYQTLKMYVNLYFANYKLIIYNNSPEFVIPELENALLVNSTKNTKLPEAYNYALNYAIENECKWLLLIDQDTELSEDYFNSLSVFLNINKDDNIVAVVPTLKDGEQILSPKRISSVGWWEYQLRHTGIQHGRVIAFNSLSLLRVGFLKTAGGFSEKYPLDMLDHWYYNQIYLQRKQVYVLDCTISHNLSFQNYEKDVDINRHIEFLEAERLFVSELGPLHYTVYKIKLLLRSLKQFIIFKNKRYAKMTLKKLFD